MPNLSVSVLADPRSGFLCRDQIDALRRYSTPTVAKAVEILVGEACRSFTAGGVRCHFPGALSWVPYGAAGFGSASAGLVSDWLLRNRSLNFARKAALGAGAILLPASLGITNAPLAGALFYFSLAFLGHQAFSTIMQTLVADLFPPNAVGTVAGWMGAAGSLGGIASNWLAGWWLTGNGSYSALFAVAGILHPLSFLIICATIRRVERISIFEIVE